MVRSSSRLTLRRKTGWGGDSAVFGLLEGQISFALRLEALAAQVAKEIPL